MFKSEITARRLGEDTLGSIIYWYGNFVIEFIERVSKEISKKVPPEIWARYLQWVKDNPI